MLGLRDRSNYRHIPAEVIGKNTNYGKNTIVIDVGSKGGVNRYMAVAAPEGVVGRVIEVGPWSAVVQLLSDKDSKVSALVQRSRTQGSISWRQEHGLDMRLPLRSDIRVGDAIVTSGMGGTFPPGLRIGHVEQLQLDDTGLFKQATIRPRVDLNRIEEVFVIMPGTDSDQNKPEERVRLDERFSLKSEQSGTR
jgi:rod shape-determining protein MreC